MEKIPAACAMGWSIELEKGLRSRKPGHSIEAINLIGPRLKQWSREPQTTMAVYNMYALVPGEDRLFADTILLRLADAFVSGNRETKISVMRVFLSILRQCKRNDRQAHGIFTNMSLENRLELLRRVKVVLTAESVESRALTLVLLGCWADIATDVAEIRHAILSTLLSCHVLEVKASLFAAGCYSENSDDFASVFLESLLKLMNSSKTLPALRICGARTFSKMGCSTVLAMKAYKAGAELVSKTSEEDILATMLISLTKLSLKASILITDQMLAYALPDMIVADDFMKLLKFVEDATRSPVFSTRLLAFQILVHISNKLKGKDEIMVEVNSITNPTGIVSAISDQITLLVKLVPGGTSSAEVEQELGSMLKVLLLLFENHSELGSFILNKLNSIIKNMANSQNMPSSAIQVSEIHKAVNAGIKQNFPMRVVMFYIYRFMVAFLEILDDYGAITNEIISKLRQLGSFVCNSIVFDCSTHTFFALLQHYLVNWSLPSEDHSSFSSQGLSGSPKSLLDSETLIHGCAKNILAGGDNWCAYKVGRYAACQGEWYVASFIFQHLEERVQSDFCCQWLKFLVKYTNVEKNVKVLLEQSSHCLPLDRVLVPSAADNSPMGIISNEYIEKLVDAFEDVSLSDKILEAISLQTQTLCFQRWFTALRLKVLLVLGDILKLLKGCLDSKTGLFNKHTGGNDFTDGEPSSQKMKEVMSSLAVVSARLASLAEEYDLISSSFIDLDPESLKVISALAFSCSLLAFCTAFTNLIANSPVFADLTKESGYCQTVIIKDLALRLCYIDSETCMNLMSFFKEYQLHERSVQFLPGFRMSRVGHLSKDILTLCRSSIRQFIGLQNECLNVEDEDTVWQVYKDHMQLLLNIVAAWMHIPFRVPKYFFRVRPTVGSLLVSVNAGSRKQNELYVSRGSHLALNLSILLKNVTSDVSSRFSKIHCVLHCKTSFLGTRRIGQPSREGWTGYQASETDIAIELNKKLRCHIMKRNREFMNCSDHQSDSKTVETCVCFETNGTSQGFSNCLLDVSAFPVGSYRIHWHSGGIDHQGTYWSFLPLSPCPEFSVR
ncbi:uncharacterized protein LOC104908123 isoform X2 [Beta vulgaris subsp. vulgaris]|uniref:uncharacterized protein LOC104908123 isoform X2 n=1 Tax=Beta vulgaris subsp. vulgaris TaxID=3555 RepID=UPI0020368431|nr:uncharacterized protein LOC104908123 isoform X2 [Beta vulgaris subsp. vulgaris]